MHDARWQTRSQPVVWWDKFFWAKKLRQRFITADSGFNVHSFGHWVAAKCAALPIANACLFAPSNCKPHAVLVLP